MPGVKRLVFFTRTLLLCGVMMHVRPPAASAHHRARLDPTEPIFTERSFVEKNLELDTGWEKQDGGNGLEFSPGASWVFRQRLELDLEMPVGLQIPSRGATVGSLGDVAVGAQLLLCCEPNQLLDYFSLRLDVEAPTGSRSKDIGGTGSWSVSVLPGRLFTIAEQLPDLFVQAQISYAEQLRPDDEARATAADLSQSAPREKQVEWNVALAQQYLDGRLRPVFELLGTSIVDAVAGGEGTIVELAAGLWTAPFPDDLWLSPVSIGLGWKWPVTSRRDSELTALLILEWSFGN
jgi:hypothetical protein